jgi:ABC-type transport system involved in multi-copper enzyme maturation permease subunit
MRAQIGVEIKNRLRSPASLVAFGILLVGSYWAIPPADGQAVSMSWRLPDGRLQAPLYTAGYLGIALSVLALIFFLLAAFYLVAGSVRADRERGLGPLLAATPLSKSGYIGGKFVAHAAYLVLLSLLALPVGVFHFLRSGEGAFDAVSFFVPHLMVVLPAAAFVAAAALLFDVTPILRSRAGLVLWFLFGMMPMIALSVDTKPPREPRIFDPLGFGAQVALSESSLPAGATDVSTGYVFLDQKPERVAWPGVRLDGRVLGQRALNLLWALLPLGLAVLLFDRFDTARWAGRRRREEAETPLAAAAAERPAPTLALAALTPALARPSLPGALAAEARLLWESAGLGKWLVVPAALVAALVPNAGAPIAASVFLLLLTPLIAEVACRERQAGTRGLVFSQPGVPESVVLWKCGAIAAFLLLVSLPLLVRAVLRSPLHAAALGLGMLAIAAFAAAGAALTGGGKLFSGIYLLLWYLALNGLAAVDLTGLLAPAPTWPPRFWSLAVGAVFLALARVVERARRRRSG